jgi:four helix bundle protein
MRDHTKLRAFDLADALALAVYKATANFPREEMFGLTSQLRRAAISIASNIVEGCARFSEAEYVHFLDMAYGSAREVEFFSPFASGLRPPVSSLIQTTPFPTTTTNRCSRKTENPGSGKVRPGGSHFQPTPSPEPAFRDAGRAPHPEMPGA